MTAVAGERTTRPRSERLAALVRRPPVVAVVVPWIATRVLAGFILTIVGAANGHRPDTHRLLAWDGGWYQLITDHGYGPKPTPWPPGLGGWTTLPFFPLFPVLWRGFVSIGFPHTAAAVVIGAAATLVATWGTWRLAQRHVSERVARHAVWLVGLLPGSLTFAMAYPDAIYLAATVWAFLFVERRHYALAGVAAAVAATARPNGIIVLVPLAIAIVSAPHLSRALKVRAGALVAVPAMFFFVSWCVFLWVWMGDPLAFLTAKRAWHEVSLFSYLQHPMDLNASWNLVAGALAVALYVHYRRRQPVAWTVHAFLIVLPALGLGLVGIVRYTSQCFVTPIALADLTNRYRRFEGTMFALAASALVVYGYLTTTRNYVP
jgi:hypothetical protein